MLKIEFSVKLFVYAQIRRMLQQNWFGVMPSLHGWQLKAIEKVSCTLFQFTSFLVDFS